jgi:hypothetical protein
MKLVAIVNHWKALTLRETGGESVCVHLTFFADRSWMNPTGPMIHSLIYNIIIFQYICNF